jgi:hypothetical protein
MTVAQTPDISFQLNSATLTDFINFNENDIVNGKHVVPLTFPGSSPFRAGHRDSGDGGFWDPLGTVDSKALHKFSLATCNGCHRISTGTNFLHIEPREIGAMSVLSDFLTGADMPKGNHTFHELLDRQEKLEATASMTCGLPGDFALDELEFIPREPALLH